MKKLIFFIIIIIAVAAFWRLRESHLHSQQSDSTQPGERFDLNEKVRRLPPHLQRRVVNALEEAGRSGLVTVASDLQPPERASQAPRIPLARSELAGLSPETRRKLERLPASVRQKALDALGEARQHQTQP